MKLRPYQQEAVDSVLNCIREWKRLLLMVVPTGGWKTVMFNSLVPFVRKAWKKTLILAHREELLQQAMDKLKMVVPDATVSLERAWDYADQDVDVVVASVATLWRANSERIKRFNPSEYWLIVVDEAHHVTSTSYRNILRHFWANKEDWLSSKHPVLLWVTATPSRRDNEWLDQVFDDIAYKIDIKQLIDEGYLSNIRAYTINTKQFINVWMRAWDFELDELSKQVNVDARNQLIVDSYRDICEWEKAVAFCVDVKHSESLAEKFKEAWYKSEAIHGNLSMEQRKSILERFTKWEIDVMTNCMILTEWWDESSVRAVLFARPTSSSSLYIQMAWRWLRLHEWKDFCRFLDFVDNMQKHSIISASTLIWLDKPIKANWELIMNYKSKFDELLENKPWTDVSTVDLDKIDAVIKEVDIFKMAELPELVQKFSKLSWTQTPTWFKIWLWQNTDWTSLEATISENTIGQYVISVNKLIEQTPDFRNGYTKYRKEVLHSDVGKDRISALEKADTYISQNYRDKIWLVSQDAGRRQEKPSEKQISLLKKFGYPNAEKLSKWEACNLLSKHMWQKKPANKTGFKKFNKSLYD